MIKLVDAWDMHAAHPTTFIVPTVKQLAQIRVGIPVKLIFIQESDMVYERMWVNVTGVQADSRFIGKLDNDPTTSGLSCGDEVEFGLSNVTDVFLVEVPEIPQPFNNITMTHGACSYPMFAGPREIQ
jgi:hypothetical protein